MAPVDESTNWTFIESVPMVGVPDILGTGFGTEAEITI
jgi:hypothetical protein